MQQRWREIRQRWQTTALRSRTGTALSISRGPLRTRTVTLTRTALPTPNARKNHESGIKKK